MKSTRKESIGQRGKSPPRVALPCLLAASSPHHLVDSLPHCTSVASVPFVVNLSFTTEDTEDTEGKDRMRRYFRIFFVAFVPFVVKSFSSFVHRLSSH